MERNKVYSEVRIDYFDQDANFWCVDAWKSDNDDEEGKCVGIIHPSGDYYIFDYKAMFCENVIDAVNEKVREIKSNAVKTSDEKMSANMDYEDIRKLASKAVGAINETYALDAADEEAIYDDFKTILEKYLMD